MAKTDISKIKFSVDLQKQALKHLDFLEEVNNLRFDEATLAKAAYRYEKIWIPFYLKHYSSHSQIFPPIDVAFIWHCHMLSPTNYEKDCLNMCGKIIDYELLTLKEIHSKQTETKPIWESEYFNNKISFEFQNNSSIDQRDFNSFQSNFDYNLIEAGKRQLSFYYQVSLKHYRSKEFLTLALNRYKKFLNLKVINPKSYIVPCYAIDLIWHTHQLHPINYKNDTIRITGKTVKFIYHLSILFSESN